MTDHDDSAAKVFPHERYLAGATAAFTRKLTPTEKKQARRALSEFFAFSEQHAAKINYTQARPFDPTVDPLKGYSGDCSSYGTQAFQWVKSLTGLPLHDPNGTVEWDGYGWTGTLWSTNHTHPVPLERRFYVGDLALYGTSFWNTKHVIFCSQAGTADTASWSSHGSGAGPLSVRLHYRSDLLGCYRPLSLL